MKFKKGDTVYNWSSKGEVESFSCIDASEDCVQHPHGAWIYYYEDKEFYSGKMIYPVLFTKEEMKKEVEETHARNIKTLE